MSMVLIHTLFLAGEVSLNQTVKGSFPAFLNCTVLKNMTKFKISFWTRKQVQDTIGIFLSIV